MQLFGDDWPHEPPQIEARIVMTTGSHHMQNYWIRRPELGEGPGPNSGALVQLPWVWLISEGRWVPTQDSFVRPPSSSVQAAEIWNANCSQCHSVGTEPRVLDHVGRFDTRTVELGITCEACHGPAEEHVRLYRSPLRRYLRYFRELREDDPPDPTIVHPAKLDPRRSVATCAQCHSFGEWTDQQAYRTSGVPFRPGDELDTYRHLFRYGDPLLPADAKGQPPCRGSQFLARRNDPGRGPRVQRPPGRRPLHRERLDLPVVPLHARLRGARGPARPRISPETARVSTATGTSPARSRSTAAIVPNPPAASA